VTRLDFAPLLMPAPAAAHYLGVGETTLRGLPIRRKVLGGKRLYDKRDLDDFANGLVYEGEGAEAAACDDVFGMGVS
jgi:hypothetical protein